ncbi:Arginine/serine-rich coiled-coil protein 2 [Paragonimus heterotremus]|uniref:Arginine/serine-rich coiled-coil protein 2 n=1 Tax=Paragonimus heterotremus TaxID=100268 RepID=A0A8J4WSQ2_9TREM|nr:Arginine/serine-rich coiled-coil protein 2 [Paragonimus heterotremus]
MDAASRMLCDYASSVQSSDDDSDTSQRKPRKLVQRGTTAESSKSKLSSISDALNERVSHPPPNKEVNGRQNSSSSEDHLPPSEVRHHDVDPSRSRHRRHRDHYVRRKRHSRSRSNSHSRRHSKRGHSKRHRHSRHECCDRHRHSASKSRHRHRRHRRHSTPSSTSSSSASSRSRCRVHVKEAKRLSDAPTQAVLDTTSAKGTESSNQKSDSVQSASASTLSTVTTQAPISLQTTTTTPAVTTASLAPRINAQEILNQIQKHQEAQAKAQAIAAAATANLPKYYNPTSVNPLKLAEQQEKRKLLWSKKKDDSGDPKDSKTSLWTTTSIIAGKGDTAAAAKFRKLMGIHDDADLKSRDGRDVNIDTDAQKRAEEQAELFRRLELEYEQSRALTHTQRGVGLGFSSTAHVDYNAYSAMQQETRDKTS